MVASDLFLASLCSGVRAGNGDGPALLSRIARRGAEPCGPAGESQRRILHGTIGQSTFVAIGWYADEMFALVTMSMLIPFHSQGIKLSSCVGALASHSGLEDTFLPLPESDRLNQAFLSMARDLNSWLGTDAPLYYSPSLENAYSASSDAKVVIGEPLLRHAQAKGPSAVITTMSFLLAHEYSHQFQFKIFRESPSVEEGMTVPIQELQADILAGFVAGWNTWKQKDDPRRTGGADPSQWVAASRSGYMSYAASIGDFAFSDPDHHGTPDQRSAALKAGWERGESSSTTSLKVAFDKGLFRWSRNTAEAIERN